MTLRLQPAQVETGSDDTESRLVFDDERLVAVLVRLSDRHESDAGKWFLEVGFGCVDDPRKPIFRDLGEAERWISGRLAQT
ncbi:hypothetical protein [Methylobacterium soli]|uniref:Uncharacterized protein n=1 Tax=Methylobacterium soli TaxID=553447 RepID=A0A6L3SZB7_9HYPH|nr:hypothetical protein [Methylobacterium soli]KAB1077667.1 hypothetical protein F6X53_18260 [Methylobacterium soli]GJE44807.1 hypothetical protein AEGHOMDF_3998 [Methylobacterium soli]